MKRHLPTSCSPPKTKKNIVYLNNQIFGICPKSSITHNYKNPALYKHYSTHKPNYSSQSTIVSLLNKVNKYIHKKHNYSINVELTNTTFIDLRNLDVFNILKPTKIYFRNDGIAHPLYLTNNGYVLIIAPICNNKFFKKSRNYLKKNK